MDHGLSDLTKKSAGSVDQSGPLKCAAMSWSLWMRMTQHTLPHGDDVVLARIGGHLAIEEELQGRRRGVWDPAIDNARRGGRARGRWRPRCSPRATRRARGAAWASTSSSRSGKSHRSRNGASARPARPTRRRAGPGSPARNDSAPCGSFQLPGPGLPYLNGVSASVVSAGQRFRLMKCTPSQFSAKWTPLVEIAAKLPALR